MFRSRVEATEAVKNFPQEILEHERWVNWQEVPQNDGKKPRKKPMDPKVKYNPVGAHPSDPSTWAGLEEAFSMLNGETGIGYVFLPPYVGIDLDDVEEEVQRHLDGDYEDNIVSDFIFAFDSYTEISVSGTGIHIIIKGDLPKGRNKNGDFEMYTEGRYFVMTGKSINGSEITDHTVTGVLEEYYYKYIDNKKDEKKKPVRQSTVSNTTGGNDLTDEEIIEIASKSKNGARFKALYEGNFDSITDKNGGTLYPSHSEADGALTMMLAFWTAKDGDQMDRIFRESGLMRDKWDELRGVDTYGDITINSAIEAVDEVFVPDAPKAQPMNRRARISSTPYKDTWKFNRDEPTREDIGKYFAHPSDDTGNADRILDRYGDIFKHNFKRGKYYLYNGQYWELDEKSSVQKLVDYTVDSIQDEDWTEGMVAYDEDSEKVIEKREEDKQKHITRSRSRASKGNMLELAHINVPVLDDEFNTIDYVINAENGYVDLRDGSFNKSDKEMMFSMMAETEVRDDIKPERWLQFLDEIFLGDQELIDFIQRAVGYTLTGEIIEQCMFLLIGEGSNGKSTFVETLREMFGTYASNIQASSLSTRSQGAMTNDLAKLQGTRFVTSSEPDKGYQFDEGMIKEMTGGEVITSRFLFGEEFDYTPKFKLWIASNYKPTIEGTDDGIWRRLHMIPFDAKFEDEGMDKRLKEKLLEELPGIFQWAVEGAMKWYDEGGLKVPELITKTTDDYRGDMDVIGKFLDDVCEVNPNGSTGSTALWNKYTGWVDKYRYTPLNRTEFGQEMVKRYDRKQVNGLIAYAGIELKY